MVPIERITDTVMIELLNRRYDALLARQGTVEEFARLCELEAIRRDVMDRLPSLLAEFKRLCEARDGWRDDARKVGRR